MDNIAITTIRDIIGKMDLDDTFCSRDLINDQFFAESIEDEKEVLERATEIVETFNKNGIVHTETNTPYTVDEVKEVMAETRYRSYPVLDLNGHVIGSISRYQLLKGERKKVIQVDHNERAQSIPGIEEADILEIIDHHRLADIQTNSPIFVGIFEKALSNSIFICVF